MVDKSLNGEAHPFLVVLIFVRQGFEDNIRTSFYLLYNRAVLRKCGHL